MWSRLGSQRRRHQGQTGMLPGKRALQGLLGPSVQVRVDCSIKQEKGLGKAALTLCPWGGLWILEQDLALGSRSGEG